MLYSRTRPNAGYDDGMPTVWWEGLKPGDDGYVEEYSVHRLLFPHIKALEEDQSDIHLQNILNAKLYSNRELMAFEWDTQIATSFRALSANLENLVQSTADTMHSRLSVNRPRAKVVTRGADFGVYQKGRLLDRFIWGEFQHHKVWAKAERAWIYDPMIYGTGTMKIGIDEITHEVFVERVHPDEIVVDQRECISGELPLCLAQRKLVSKVWLLKTFGSGNSEKAKETRRAIMETQGKGWRYTSYRSPCEDQVVLVQAWKRPTYKGAGDGRMVMCIENHTFVDKPYTRDKFPFVFVRWRDPESGFYGLPMVSDIMGYQINQNEMNDLFRHGRDLTCVPRIFIEQGSDVQIHQIDNSIGKFIRYRGTMPECITWPAFNPEMYNERERNRSNAYEFLGLSQAGAQADAPTQQTRFDSSEALALHSQHQDARLIKPAMKIEEAYMEMAEHIVELTAALYKNKTANQISRTSTSYISHSLVQQIDWSEVDMDRDKYVLQISASSVLSMTPAARTDKLEGWLRDQKITLEQYYSLSGEPDLERMTDRLAAQSDHVEHMVDLMLKGIPQTPTPFDNLELLFNIVHDELMRVMAHDSGEGDDDQLTVAIDLLMQCLEIAQEEMKPTPDPMMQPANPEMNMAPGDPMAAGGGMMAPPMGAPPMDPTGVPAGASTGLAFS